MTREFLRVTNSFWFSSHIPETFLGSQQAEKSNQSGFYGVGVFPTAHLGTSESLIISTRETAIHDYHF